MSRRNSDRGLSKATISDEDNDEDEENLIELQEEKGIHVNAEVVVAPEYETDEDRPIRGAEPPYPGMNDNDDQFSDPEDSHRVKHEEKKKERKGDATNNNDDGQIRTMFSLDPGTSGTPKGTMDSDSGDDDGFSVQNRQLVKQLDNPLANEKDELQIGTQMTYPPGAPPAYYSEDEEEAEKRKEETEHLAPPPLHTRPFSDGGPNGVAKGGEPGMTPSMEATVGPALTNILLGAVKSPLERMNARSRSMQEESDEDHDSDIYPGGPRVTPPAEEPEDDSYLEHLSVDERTLIAYFAHYTAEEVEIEAQLMPFPMDMSTAVGDLDPFIKIPRPDEIEDNVGLVSIDEPASVQSDPVIVDMQMRTTVKDVDKKPNEQPLLKRVERADRNAKPIDDWIKNIKELHRTRPTAAVHYSRAMPDVEKLMQEWPEQFETLMKQLMLPTAELDVPLEQFVDIVLSLLDIPIHGPGGRIQGLHLLFSTYMEFKNSQHFRNVAAGKEPAKPRAERLEL